MVCLCGRTIFNERHTLIDHESRSMSYHLWQQFTAERLYDAISKHDTFHSMIEVLFRAEASSCINLLRSRFAGFLGDVTLTDTAAINDANVLTSEGILLRPNRDIACYRMASPLMDGFIRTESFRTNFRLLLHHKSHISPQGVPTFWTYSLNHSSSSTKILSSAHHLVHARHRR